MVDRNKTEQIGLKIPKLRSIMQLKTRQLQLKIR